MKQKTSRELQLWVDMAKETVIDYHHTKPSALKSNESDYDVIEEPEDGEKIGSEPEAEPNATTDVPFDDATVDDAADRPSDPRIVDSQVMILNLHNEITTLKERMLANQKLILSGQNFLEHKKIRDDQDMLEKDIIIKVCHL